MLVFLTLIVIWVLGLATAPETGGASTLGALIATASDLGVLLWLAIVGIVIALWFFLFFLIIIIDCLINFVSNLFIRGLKGAWDNLWDDLSTCFSNFGEDAHDGVIEGFQAWWRKLTGAVETATGLVEEGVGLVKKGWRWVKGWFVD